jgi:phosphoenolpyruvate synthase/pyruvate phosphate dikinase
LARIRKLIQTMPLLPEFEKELAKRMRDTFGPDGTYGVFVRSDTNAEDLPEFTGAGLNLTVPNQVGYRNITQSLKDVWASPFEERAWDWRSRILQSSVHVYPSVLLLRAVPSDKSGVIATVNLDTGEDDITVNVSEGVSAVVDGGVAESLLLKPDGTVRLLEQARGTYRKMLKPGGDFQNVPVSGSDTVLMPDEIRQLREMVAEVKRKYPPAYSKRRDVLPWDIEFGFEKGQLRLFQIRPLARYQEERTLEALSHLDASPEAAGVVHLDERPQ